MRYKTVIEYDGSGFHGWQRQKTGCRTVQAEFERAAEHMTGEPVTAVASGRTDEGVHALGQVVHFDCAKQYPPDVMARALNHWLPEDVRVISCEIVADTFDARKSAKRKTYEYVMYTAETESPLRRTRELYIGRSADADLMDSAARLLVGTHDFSAFMSSGSSAKTFTRTIYSAGVRAEGDRIVFRITGSGEGTLTIQSAGSNRTWTFSDIDGYVEADSEQMNFYKDTLLKNDTVTGSGFPLLYPGDNTVSFSGGITALAVTPRWCTL